MKIALIINSTEYLESWQLRVVDYILSDDSYSLCSFLLEPIEEKNSISPIFKVQNKIENKIFSFNKYTKNNLQDIEILKTCDINSIKNLNLDLIIDLTANSTNIEIIELKETKLWRMFFCEREFNYTNALLKNMIEKKDLNSIDLVLFEDMQTYTIDSAKTNSSFSFAKSLNELLETSATLMIKYLNIQKNSKMQLYSFSKKCSTCAIDTKLSLQYIKTFYKTVMQKVYKRVAYKLFKTRYDCWALFVLEDNYINSNPSSANLLMPPKSEFWADPFLFKYGSKTYIFFEKYDYDTKLGIISCGVYSNGKLIDITDVLTKDYHLSYPFIYSDESGVYMIPETSENRRLEVYKCVDFPNKWQLYSTAFEGEILLDTTIYKDDTNNLWLFTNKQSSINSPVDSELYIYKIDSLKLTDIEPHSKNPVIINSEKARNGGSIFKRGENIYRPSQANIGGVYGKHLNINKIIKLNLHEYKEETIKVVEANFHENLTATHHLCQLDNISVTDAMFNKI